MQGRGRTAFAGAGSFLLRVLFAGYAACCALGVAAAAERAASAPDSSSSDYQIAEDATALMNSYCAAGRLREAKTVFDMITALNSNVITDSLKAKAGFTMLSFLCRGGDYASAKEVLGTMKSLRASKVRDERIAQSLFNMVSSLARTGNLREAYEAYFSFDDIQKNEEVDILRYRTAYNLAHFLKISGDDGMIQKIREDVKDIDHAEVRRLKESMERAAAHEYLGESQP